MHQLLRESLEPYLAARHARPPPQFVIKALRGYLSCGVLRHGFARFRCDDCAQSRLRWHMAFDHDLTLAVWRVARRAIDAFYESRAQRMGPPGHHDEAHPGSVMAIQRFGGALNLNVHFHAVYLGGAFVSRSDGTLRFLEALPPNTEELETLVAVIKTRVTRLRAGARAELERMVRYILRPPLKETRLTLHADGVQLELKTPWRDGTTHIRMSRERFLDRLVALVSPPAANTLLYGGILGANARLRVQAVDYERPGIVQTRPITTRGPRPLGRVDAPLGYAHDLTKQLAPAADVVLPAVGDDFIRHGSRQLSLF